MEPPTAAAYIALNRWEPLQHLRWNWKHDFNVFRKVTNIRKVWADSIPQGWGCGRGSGRQIGHLTACHLKYCRDDRSSSFCNSSNLFLLLCNIKPLSTALYWRSTYWRVEKAPERKQMAPRLKHFLSLDHLWWFETRKPPTAIWLAWLRAFITYT